VTVADKNHNLIGESGQVKDMTFSLYRDQHGVTRVNPPEQMKTAKKK
jgi:hypothetical protein